MNLSLRLTSRIAFLSSILLVFIVSIILIEQLSALPNPDLLTIGITLDLTLVVALIYFLMIRKTSIPNITVVPAFVVSSIIAGYILPPDRQEFLQLLFNFAIPVIELSVLGFITYKVVSLSKEFKKEEGPDFSRKFWQAAYQVFQNKFVASVFTTETNMFYYLLFKWKNKQSGTSYTYHKNSGIVAILYTVGFLTVAEIFVVHVLVAHWSITTAWVLTAISIYTLFQIVSLAKSMTLRPINLTEDTLEINYGWFKECDISLSNIESLETISDQNTPGLKLVLFKDMEEVNVSIQLKEPVEINGIYGLNKVTDRILLSVDQGNEFVETVRLNFES